MKRIITTIIVALFCFTAFSQGHMKFKGHEIDGTPMELAKKLVGDGYKFIQQYETGEIEMQGVFSGSEGTIVIEPNVNGIAQKVMVIYNASTYTWKSLKAWFENLESGLTQKYGEPVKAIKDMDEILYYDGSGYEMMGFRQGKNDYTYAWVNEYGVIGLMIMATSDGAVFLTLWYQDTANSEVSSQAEYDDL